MTGKDILLQALRGGATPRPAWIPFVGVHGGKLLGVPADEYLQSSKLMTDGLKKAHDLYEPDALPVCFDLQVEAEILGCELRWAKDVPPSVVSHPLASGTLDDLPAFDGAGKRFPIILKTLDALKRGLGGATALYGLVTGPFTLALHLRGNEIFLDMFDSPDGVAGLMRYCAGITRASAGLYLDHGADVIAVVDPMTSQISPEHFDQFVAGPLNEVFAFVRERRALSSLFVCGDATRNLEAMCRTQCDNVSVDENIALETLRDIAARNGKSFGGNLKLTTVLLLGDADAAKLDAIRCIDVGGTKGFVLAPGCDLPYGVPEENLQAVARMVHDDYAREVARISVKARDAVAGEDVVLPDYDSDKRVFIDVVTLDSTACAPCQYMVEAVEKAARAADVGVVVKEHKIKTREGVGFMCKLGVGNLPTICIDGQIRYVSQIPDQPSLIRAIRERAEAKRSR